MFRVKFPVNPLGTKKYITKGAISKFLKLIIDICNKIKDVFGVLVYVNVVFFLYLFTLRWTMFPPEYSWFVGSKLISWVSFQSFFTFHIF